MKVVLSDGDRLVLSSPPGGVGGVILTLIVGAVMTGGGIMFYEVGQSNGLLGTSIPGAVAGLFGFGVLLLGIGLACTRDRLILDRVAATGAWSRSLFGKNLKEPINFAWSDVKYVRLEHHLDPSLSYERGPMDLERLRARILIDQPRRAVLLDEGEPHHHDRIRGIASAVADFLDMTVDDTTGDATGDTTGDVTEDATQGDDDGDWRVVD